MAAAAGGGLFGEALDGAASPLTEPPASAVAAWGSNGQGQLGNGTTTSSDVPVAVSGLSGVEALAAGDDFSVALMDNGTVMTWGENTAGQLGNGTNTSSDLPVAVSGLSGVTGIAAGVNYVLAVLGNGNVMAWGHNRSGQLGDGATNEGSNVPVQVSGLTGVKAVAASYTDSMALLSNGKVMTWGGDSNGELGNGTKSSTGSDVPVAVSGLSGVTAIAAGGNSDMALLNNGTVMAWGSGKLGTGASESDVPVAVNGLSGVTAIANGSFSSVALLEDGAVVDWGSGEGGELGNGSETSSAAPVPVSGLSGVTAIASGYVHSTALLANGTVMDWGSNEDGRLGNGTTTSSDVPVAVSGLTGATEIADGSGHDLAIVAAPAVSVAKIEPAEGPPAGGTAVKVTGSGFTGATAVKFGSTSAASFKVESETLITAVSPAGSGVVDVTVTTPQGTSATGAADRFTFNEAPVVTAISPNSGEESGGRSVTITGNNFTGASAVKFGSANASSFKVESNTSIKAVSPAGKGKVDVTVTAAGATSATSSADQFRYDGPSTCTPRESEAPIVTSVQPSSGPAAGGNSVTITGSRFYASATCEGGGPIQAFNPRKVFFGSKQASSLIEKSETEVIAVAPPGTGTVNVTVETFAIGPAGPNAQYTYTSPAPTLTKLEPSSGAKVGGASVTITGTNLIGATAVKFGSTNAASFKVNSETSITAVSPPGSGTAEVTVVTPSGTSPTSSADQFTYQAEPCEETVAPVVISIKPKSGPEAGGTEVKIRGQHFETYEGCAIGLSVRKVMFGEKEASFKWESESAITAIAPPGAGTVDVTVVTTVTSATSSADRYTYTPPVPPEGPTAVTGTASSVRTSTATLHGTVDPNGSEVTKCAFEYGTTTSYGASVPCAGLPGSETSAIPVSAALSGLAGNTTYHFRLSATNAGGTSVGSDETFTTIPSARWYSDGVLLGTEPTPVISWGTLTLKTTTGGSGRLTCHTAQAGTVFNPGGGGTGEGETAVLGLFDCEQVSMCPKGEVLRVAPALPWPMALFAPGGVASLETEAVRLKLACFTGEFEESEKTFLGSYTASVHKGTSALHPSSLEYATGSPTLEAESEGTGGAIHAQIEGEVKLLGSEEQELIYAKTP